MLRSTVSWLNQLLHIFGIPLKNILTARKSWILPNTGIATHWIILHRYSLPNKLSCSLLSHSKARRDDTQFYHRFGYTDPLALERIVRDAVDNMHRFQSEHVYVYEEMGFTREEIFASYADIFARLWFRSTRSRHSQHRLWKIHA